MDSNNSGSHIHHTGVNGANRLTQGNLASHNSGARYRSQVQEVIDDARLLRIKQGISTPLMIVVKA